jgi:uncharacterized membrane protein YphA (DoxX/SURF4 family)
MAKKSPDEARPPASRSAAKPASKSAPAPSFGLVLVRVATGGLLFVSGMRKLETGISADLVTRTSAAWAEGPDLARAWGEHVVLRHPALVAHAVVWGEIALGALLFLGLLTRPAGVLGAFLFANAIFAVEGSQKHLAGLLLVCCLACALSRAGRSAGADVYADGRLPGWLTWSRG